MTPRAPSIVILTGAGISAESGIRTFRDQNGLWEDHRIEDVATPEGFARNPQLVQAFYNARRKQLLSPEVTPNPAHLALAHLQREWRSSFLLVTQNVDDLHERAGSHGVLHMHGELLRARCRHTEKDLPWREDLDQHTPCPCCKKPGALRPHIVWFGEMPFEMDLIFKAVAECDLFLSIGTSGNVYPAAGFVHETPRRARRVEINLEPSMMSNAFDEHVLGPAGREVPKFVDRLLDAPSNNPIDKP
ncbi:MAG: Sir2 family NAD+-dependent deacetylase [Bacteriovoracia bacterium]